MKSKTMDNIIGREFKRYFGLLIFMMAFNIGCLIYNFWTMDSDKLLKGLSAGVNTYFMVTMIFLIIAYEFRNTNLNDIGLILLTLGIMIRVAALVYDIVESHNILGYFFT